MGYPRDYGKPQMVPTHTFRPTWDPWGGIDALNPILEVAWGRKEDNRATPKKCKHTGACRGGETYPAMAAMWCLGGLIRCCESGLQRFMNESQGNECTNQLSQGILNRSDGFNRKVSLLRMDVSFNSSCQLFIVGSMFCPWMPVEGLSWFNSLYVFFCSCSFLFTLCMVHIVTYIWHCICVHVDDEHLHQQAQGFTTSHFFVDPCYIANLTAAHRRSQTSGVQSMPGSEDIRVSSSTFPFSALQNEHVKIPKADFSLGFFFGGGARRRGFRTVLIRALCANDTWRNSGWTAWHAKVLRCPLRH